MRYNVKKRDQGLPLPKPLDNAKTRRRAALNLEMSDPEFRALAVAVRQKDDLKAEALKADLRMKYPDLDRLVEGLM